MNRTVQRLAYEWPPNLTQYEAAVIAGLTAVEAIAVAVGFILPFSLLDNKLLGGIGGLLVAALVLLSLRKVERWGNRPLPVYLFRRLMARRGPRTVQLTQIMGATGAMIHVEDERGETIITLE